MRKNVFRMIAQSICIGAIGLLAGTSLDYAYSGYGMLNNPNLWAESTTTAANEECRFEAKGCECFEYQNFRYREKDDHTGYVEIKWGEKVNGTASRCSKEAPITAKDCSVAGVGCSEWSNCAYYYFENAFDGIKKYDACSL